MNFRIKIAVSLRQAQKCVLPQRCAPSTCRQNIVWQRMVRLSIESTKLMRSEREKRFFLTLFILVHPAESRMSIQCQLCELFFFLSRSNRMLALVSEKYLIPGKKWNILFTKAVHHSLSKCEIGLGEIGALCYWIHRNKCSEVGKIICVSS